MKKLSELFPPTLTQKKEKKIIFNGCKLSELFPPKEDEKIKSIKNFFGRIMKK